ncbi:hypothetical protein QBC37DRAFT_271573 [Rhypophila decipiens]|uniref:Glycosyltransferase family 32 protein n=1 Tax=Rhypophila decipiens TaxID=261697 RepID=A0AAN7BFU1_9PEZI|nr:hypothetical protein QBC37DRAFT_271573 [Rhypophila decipiens]
MATFRFRLLVLISAFVLAYLTFPWLIYFGDYVRQTNPWSGQKYTELAFTASGDELACLHGRPLPSEESKDEAAAAAKGKNTLEPKPIPNIVHFVFGLKNPLVKSRAGNFDFLWYLAVRSALVSIKPEKLYLHYTYLPGPEASAADADDKDVTMHDPLANPWIKRLSKDIELVHHKPAPSSGPDQDSPARYAHLSDTLRLDLLQSQGGIYLDMDSFALRSFEELRNPPAGHDIILGHEGGNRWGLCNAVMLARPNSTFLTRWIKSYENVDLSKEWNYHSVLLPKEMATAHPDEVCTLAPDAFFWPTWTWRHVDWMHESLNAKDAEYWSGQIKKHGGSLFENQRAYHAWSQMAFERYLGKLTPEVIRTRDTRFNFLMRRFLEDDL